MDITYRDEQETCFISCTCILVKWQALRIE